MEDKIYSGFRIEGNSVIKGSKVIGEVLGGSCIQERNLSKNHYLRKLGGFGVSEGLLKQLYEVNVSEIVIRVVIEKEGQKSPVKTLKMPVRKLLKAKKFHFPGFDEQRLFEWTDGKKLIPDKSKKNGGV